MVSYWNPAHNDVPQFICNHHCRDDVRCYGEGDNCTQQEMICLRVRFIIVIIGDRHPYLETDSDPWECIDSTKGNSFPENVYSPMTPIHKINGMRTTHGRSGKSPSPPNDNGIAEKYLHRARMDIRSDGDSLILTGRYDDQ